MAKELVPAFAKLVMNEDEWVEYDAIGSTDDFEAIAEFEGKELEGIVTSNTVLSLLRREARESLGKA